MSGSLMTEESDAFASLVVEATSGAARRVTSLDSEWCFECDPERWVEVARSLRDHPQLRFEMLMDLAGVDYLQYGESEWKTSRATGSGFSRGRHAGNGSADSAGVDSAAAGVRPGRFAVTVQLLSITHNRRLRLRSFCRCLCSQAAPFLAALMAASASSIEGCSNCSSCDVMPSASH